MSTDWQKQTHKASPSRYNLYFLERDDAGHFDPIAITVSAYLIEDI